MSCPSCTKLRQCLVCVMQGAAFKVRDYGGRRPRMREATAVRVAPDHAAAVRVAQDTALTVEEADRLLKACRARGLDYEEVQEIMEGRAVGLEEAMQIAELRG